METQSVDAECGEWEIYVYQLQKFGGGSRNHQLLRTLPTPAHDMVKKENNSQCIKSVVTA
jgi:hypothetical protein